MDSLIDTFDMRSDRMTQLRKLLNDQEVATSKQSEICDVINSYKIDNIHLEESIHKLVQTDRPLFDYIRKLERVEYGIWCGKCSKKKSISFTTSRPGVSPECKPERKQIPRSKSSPMSKLEREIRSQVSTSVSNLDKLIPCVSDCETVHLSLDKDRKNLTKKIDQLYNRFQDEFSELRNNIKILGSDMLYRDESDLKQKYNELERSLNEKELYYETQIRSLTESLKQLTGAFRLPTDISHSSSDNSSSEEVINSEDVLNSKEYSEVNEITSSLEDSFSDCISNRMDLIFDEKFASMMADDLLS